MSYDRELEQICPHYISDETLYVSADRKTIRPKRPIASETSVKIRLNREIEVPSTGVGTPGFIKGTRRGPLTFTDSTNRMSLRINQGSSKVCMLPIVNSMHMKNVAGILNSSYSELQFSVVNGLLRLETKAVGQNSSVFIESNSSAAAILGFPINREWRGKDLIPGWTLSTDFSAVVNDGRYPRNIVFNRPLASDQTVAEISYTTALEECRRCGGLGVENDWRFDVNGEVITIENEDLLLQELQKMVLTIRGSNPFHGWIGTNIVDSIGQKLGSSSIIQNLILADITKAFSRWQSVKGIQEKVQNITDREFPFRLLGVNFQQDPSDPTVIFIEVSVQNRSRDPIKLTRGLRLPSALDVVIGK